MTERIDVVRLVICGLKFAGRNYPWMEVEELYLSAQELKPKILKRSWGRVSTVNFKQFHLRLRSEDQDEVADIL